MALIFNTFIGMIIVYVELRDEECRKRLCSGVYSVGAGPAEFSIVAGIAELIERL